MRRACRVRTAAGWVALLAAAFATACGGGERADEVEFRPPVRVHEVSTGDVEDRIVATGSLRAREVVTLRAETSGALELGTSGDRRIREGDRVEAGEVVAAITGEDVRLAAGTEASRTRYLEAQRDYEAKKRLFDEGLISETEFRPAEAALADAKLAWERSRLTEARSKLVSPIDGVVLRLARDETGVPLADGQLVSQGLVVAEISPGGALVAEIDLVGGDVARVEPGMPARVRHHAFDDVVFDGRVDRLAPAIDRVTRTLRADVVVDDPSGRLRPGMFVEVTVVAERREGVPVVPREAVADREGVKVVFVVDKQKAEKRTVVLGLGDDETVEIREGVEPGERVVVRGLETLTDGARVNVTGS